MSGNQREEEERRKRQAEVNRRPNDVVADGAPGGQVRLADFHLAVPAASPSINTKMATLSERLDTFRSYAESNKASLIEAGFRLVANEEVKCDSCGISVPRASQLTDPMDVHFNMAPSCPFLRETASQAPNKPTSIVGSQSMTMTNAVYSQPSAATPYEVRKGLADPRPTLQYGIKFSEYATVDARVKSFVGWPYAVVKQEPKVMAICGFFYIGSADRVRCFSCGTTLRNWEPGDDPFHEHQTWAPRCDFIKALRPESVPKPTPAPESSPKPAPAPAPAPAPEPTKVPLPILRPNSTNVVSGPAATAATNTATLAAGTNAAITRFLNGGSFGNTDPSIAATPQRQVNTVPAATSSNIGGSARAQEVPTSVSSRPIVQQTPAVQREDPMTSPQVKAVLEMGVAEAVIRAVLNHRKVQGLEQLGSAVDLFVAAEQFTNVK